MIIETNWTTNTRGQINAVLDVQETTSVYGYGDEPVTLQEVKDYCKIDFDDDDTILADLITSAREELEKYTWLSFIQKRLIAILQNDCGGIEIPYGPVLLPLDETLIVDQDGDEVEICVKGLQFPYIETLINYVEITYDCGYETLPKALKTAIKAQVFYYYEHRGEEVDLSYICEGAKQKCAKFRRVFDAMI